MEKIPGLRIVGDASEENKQKVKEEIERNLSENIEAFSEKEKELLGKYEYIKTPEELELLDFANKEVDKLRESFGLDPYDVPLDNFHILPPNIHNKLTDHHGSPAVASPRKQSVFIDAEERGNNVFLCSMAMHELLHVKGHLAFEVGEDEDDIKTTVYRTGVTVGSAQSQKIGPHRHFMGLHEAIVSTQQKKMIPHMMEHPLLQKEKERLSSLDALETVNDVWEKQKIPKDDIFWVKEGGGDYHHIGYEDDRKVLRYVCKQIREEFPDKYQTDDEVFQEFLKAQFTGYLLPIARLVEGTFGEGSFRNLGDMDIDTRTPILCLESLQKARSRFLKNKKPE